MSKLTFDKALRRELPQAVQDELTSLIAGIDQLDETFTKLARRLDKLLAKHNLHFAPGMKKLVRDDI